MPTLNPGARAITDMVGEDGTNPNPNRTATLMIGEDDNSPGIGRNIAKTAAVGEDDNKPATPVTNIFI